MGYQHPDATYNNNDKNGIENLKIKDSELQEAAKLVKEFCSLLNDEIEKYYTTLKHIDMNSIKSGTTHEALEIYIDYVAKIRGKAENIGKKFDQLVECYIEEIDIADEFVYDKNTEDVRDFSTKKMEELKNFLNDDWYKFTSGIYYFFTKIKKMFVSLIPDFLDNYKGVKDDVESTYNYLKGMNNSQARNLDRIFSNVYAIERRYGKNVVTGPTFDGEDNYISCHFSSVWSALNALKNMIAKMSEIIDLKNGKFNASSIYLNLGKLYLELEKYYSDTINIHTKNSDNSIEIIEAFVQAGWTSDIFDKFNVAFWKFIADIGGKETAMMIIFNMFDVAEGEILTGDYAKSVMKKYLMDILNDIAKNTDYSDTEQAKAISDFKEFIGIVKKHGKGWKDYLNETRDKDGNLLLDLRTKNGKAFKEFIDGCKGAELILKYGDDIIEPLSIAFGEYEKNLEVLESFLENCPKDSEMYACAKELEALYKKEFSGILLSTIENVQEDNFDLLVGMVAKECGPVAVVKAIDKVIDTTGEVTGLGEQYKNMYNALIYQSMFDSSKSSYEQAYDKVKKAIENGQNSGDEYEKMVKDLENSFYLTKKSLIEMLKAMSNASTDEKKTYYDYCVSVAESKDFYIDKFFEGNGNFNIMSYEEYVENK